MTVTDVDDFELLLDGWLADKTEQTRRCYSGDVAVWSEFINTYPTYDWWPTDEALIQFDRWQQLLRGWSPATARRRCAALRSLRHHVEDRG